MPTPTRARIWRGRTRAELADAYEASMQAIGIPPLRRTSLGVQFLREDLHAETRFTVISYWLDLDAMRLFTQGDPTAIRHLARDRDFLIELPDGIEIHRILLDREP